MLDVLEKCLQVLGSDTGGLVVPQWMNIDGFATQKICAVEYGGW